MTDTDYCRWIMAIDRLDWLTHRHNYIGASEAAAVVGVSKWSSPFGVWYRKSGPVEDREPTIEQEIGHELEPFMARKFARETGIETIDPGDYAIAVSKRYPWLSCTLDRFADPMIPVELKTAKFEAAKEWQTRVPVAYQVQLMVQMLVTGASESHIVVLLNGSKLKHHRLRYHARFGERLLSRTQQFYERYMRGDERPPSDGHNATREALSSLYPAAGDEPLDLSRDVQACGREYDELQTEISEREEKKAAIQNRIKAEMGAAPLGRLSDGSGFRWSGGKTRRFTRVKKVKTDEQ